WYRIGEGHKAFNPDKTADEDFYILTLASIASELSTEQITEANVYLALGLPTTWTGRQREDYRRYMMRNPDVQFVFNDILYRIHLTDCSVFPQGYAALVPMMDNDKKYNDFQQFTGTVIMADIGNGTMNIMRLVNGKPNDQHCWTEVLGVNQCVLTARKQMMDKYGIDMPETVIEQFLRTGSANIARELLDQLTSIVRGYVTGLFDALRLHGYDARLMKLFVMGGGGCLVKNFGKYAPGSVIFVDDLHASAKGYEYMAQGLIWRKEHMARKAGG
ncbi:MAG: ParM/StbA family protein, partial [Clostridia bacterium]|nr:ParM/StbA family protein [Clostridia bacterium]